MIIPCSSTCLIIYSDSKREDFDTKQQLSRGKLRIVNATEGESLFQNVIFTLSRLLVAVMYAVGEFEGQTVAYQIEGEMIVGGY